MTTHVHPAVARHYAFQLWLPALLGLLAVVATALVAIPGAAAAPLSFSCTADAGQLSWTDDAVNKYWVYRSTDGGASFGWIGRTAGSPAPTTFVDDNTSAGAIYQVHYAGIPRVECDVVADEAPVAQPTALALPTALVTLGDSYISGEGGRWLGNPLIWTPDRGGTDRATSFTNGVWNTDVDSVYLDNTESNGCSRADVSPALSTTFAVDARINIACSGATTSAVLRASSGGQIYKGEQPQADQLAALTEDYDVDTVVLSIGGNDLGFAEMLAACAAGYVSTPTFFPRTCNREQQANVDALMDDAMADVGASIDDIAAVLAEAGDDDYRLILASYPSPLARGSEIRYPEWGPSRTFFGGCPLWNADATWARDTFVPELASNLSAVAASRGVEFLDLSDAFEGREFCSTSTSHGPGPSAAWARSLTVGGDITELAHPNAYGHQAIGRCIDLAVANDPGTHRCVNTPGAGPEEMRLG